MKKVLSLFFLLLMCMPAVAIDTWEIMPQVNFSEDSDSVTVTVEGEGQLFITITLNGTVSETIEGWEDGPYVYKTPRLPHQGKLLVVEAYAVVDGVTSYTAHSNYFVPPKELIQCPPPEIVIDETPYGISVYAFSDVAEWVQLYINYDLVDIPFHMDRDFEPRDFEIYAIAGGEDMDEGVESMYYEVEPLSIPSDVPLVTMAGDNNKVYVYVDGLPETEAIYYSADDGASWEVVHNNTATIAFPRTQEEYSFRFCAYSVPNNNMYERWAVRDVIVPAIGNIYDLSQDGIYYKIVGDNEVDVTYRDLHFCSYYGDVTIPSTVSINGTNYTVKGIHSHAFRDCSRLTSISIPPTVERVDLSAFEKCVNLSRVNITDVAAWCNTSFANETSNPMYYTHQLCLNGTVITDLVVPDGVTEIKDLAWAYCAALRSVTIPPSVKRIDYDCFSSCTGINAVYISDLSAWCDIRFAKMTSNPLYYGHRLYLNGTEVTDLVIPSDVRTIRSYAFFGFSGNTVTFPDGITFVGLEAFQNCHNLDAVYINDLSAWCNIDFNFFTSNPLSYAHRLIVNGTQLTELTIPSDVTRLYRHTFSGLSTITKLVIPNTVTAIGYGAFAQCDGLTTVTIPNSLSAIDLYVFYQCQGLQEVTLPSSITSIGVGAFNECPNLATINVLATTPPTMESNIDPAFRTATLRVPQTAVRSYQSANYWRNFVNIEGIPGAGPGDVDGDGHIGVSDVARLIDLFINNGELPPYADVDGDGMTNLRDLAALINMLLVGN